MTIKTEIATYSLELVRYNGGWDAGYEPDCFCDLETNFPHDYPERNEDGDIIAPDAAVQRLIRFWSAECAAANDGEDGDCLEALSEDELARGDEWQFAAVVL